jgi:hypothetical protein
MSRCFLTCLSSPGRGPGDVWAIDFQFDLTMAGEASKILFIVDEHNRVHLEGPSRASYQGGLEVYSVRATH